MTLEILQKEMIAAMKNNDKVRKNAISTLVQAVQKFGIDNKCKDNITEAQIDAVILKEKKTMQEMIDTCPADRVETLTAYKETMTIIEEFAPQLMIDIAEIAAYVTDTLGLEINAANRGLIMKGLKGKADMKIANQLFSGINK